MGGWEFVCETRNRAVGARWTACGGLSMEGSGVGVQDARREQGGPGLRVKGYRLQVSETFGMDTNR